MASYICKCGRVVEKSTTADNTGNRDTAGCEGCPYLLPWGSFAYKPGDGYVMDVKGKECRMSHSIDYASTYYGRADDKCTLRIVSLDLAFLEQVQVWINEHADGQLSGRFSRDTIRGTDYSQAGRYCWSIYCSQNKKGMAAKAALIQHFFDSGHRRLDMTPEEEKAHILAAIEAGKAAYQRKKENMEYIISENLENDCVYAYAAKEFWVYDKQACRWYTSGFCREQYERAKQKLPSLTPEDFLEDDNDYNLLDDYEIPCAALDALQEAVKSGKREVAPFEGTNPPTPADADASPCAPGASDVPPSPSQSAAADAQQGANDDLPEVCRGCRCTTCGNEDCPTPCHQKSDEVEECEQLGPLGDDCEDYQPKEDAECLKTPAPNGDVAAITAANAAQQPQPEETPTIPTNASSSSAPASPAGAGAATQSLSAAAPASLAADPAPKFDYSGMDIATVDALHWAEREIGEARRDYIARLAQAVYIAHDALCSTGVRNSDSGKYESSEDTFISWCKSVGLSKTTAYQLLQVNALLTSSTPEEQMTLEAASPSLLYAAAKPSAPAELVQAVKDGDITTHKQYQEAMAQLKAEREAREQIEQQLADTQREHQAERESTSALLRDEQQRRQQAEQGRIAAEKETAAAQQRAAKAEAQGKKDAALVEKLQDIVLQRDNEVAEQKERADAAEIRARQAENRPVEVAVQAPDPAEVQRLASEKAAEMTAMLKAQLRTLQTQLDDAEKRADAAANSAYLSAAEFAGQAAAMIDGIRASFWAMAKELPDTDFNQALEPLDRAVSRIFNREWEDGWDDSWENEEDTEL